MKCVHVRMGIDKGEAGNVALHLTCTRYRRYKITAQLRVVQLRSRVVMATTAQMWQCHYAVEWQQMRKSGSATTQLQRPA